MNGLADSEWGIPDWRDGAAYGDVKPWSFNRWRWEFYRRRKDIRDYFDAYASETSEYWKSYPKDNLPKEKKYFSAAHFDINEPGFCSTVIKEDRKRIGYGNLPNPRIGRQPEWAIIPYFPDSQIEVNIGDTEKLSKKSDKNQPLNTDKIAVTFDLSRPLKPQFETAKSLLNNFQSINIKLNKYSERPLQKRRHTRKWLGYLRVLDAREAGASWGEIAECFYSEGLLSRRKNPSGGYCEPPPQAARDMWEAANTLRFNL